MHTAEMNLKKSDTSFKMGNECRQCKYIGTDVDKTCMLKNQQISLSLKKKKIIIIKNITNVYNANK